MPKETLKQKRVKWSQGGSDFYAWHPFEYVKIDPVLLDMHPALAHDPRDGLNRGIDNEKALGLISREVDKWPQPYKKAMKDWMELDNISQAARLNGISRTVFTNKLNKLVKAVREEMKL